MFDAYGTTSSSSSTTKKEVDYDAMNKYVVETANLESPETLVGVVAGIVDLGEQNQPDAEHVFKGDADDEAAEIAKNPGTYFKDGLDPETKKPARLKCYAQKPQQCVAFAVDFPEIMIDKGQFFGESNPQPLRLWLGGSFYTEGKGMIIGRPTPLKVVNIDRNTGGKRWSFSPLHLCYKMAIGAKLIKPGESFLPNNIDQLIGKAFQFQVQIYMKESKGKEYYTENIKFVSGLGRGQVAPEVSNTFLVQFNQNNKPEDLKQLRNHVINTIKMANNYGTSKIKVQLEQNSSGNDEASPKVQTAPAPKQATTKSKPSVQIDDSLDDDDPF